MDLPCFELQTPISQLGTAWGIYQFSSKYVKLNVTPKKLFWKKKTKQNSPKPHKETKPPNWNCPWKNDRKRVKVSKPTAFSLRKSKAQGQLCLKSPDLSHGFQSCHLGSYQTYTESNENIFTGNRSSSDKKLSNHLWLLTLCKARGDILKKRRMRQLEVKCIWSFSWIPWRWCVLEDKHGSVWIYIQFMYIRIHTCAHILYTYVFKHVQKHRLSCQDNSTNSISSQLLSSSNKSLVVSARVPWE